MLVNNAAVYSNYLLDALEGAGAPRILQVNVEGVHLCTRAAVAQMRRQGGGGSIVNVTSIDAIHPTRSGWRATDVEARDLGLHEGDGARGRARGHPHQRRGTRAVPDGGGGGVHPGRGAGGHRHRGAVGGRLAAGADAPLGRCRTRSAAPCCSSPPTSPPTCTGHSSWSTGAISSPERHRPGGGRDPAPTSASLPARRLVLCGGASLAGWSLPTHRAADRVRASRACGRRSPSSRKEAQMHDRVCPPRADALLVRVALPARLARSLEGMSPQAAAAACGASRATGYRLWRRYQEGGWAALRDRPPVPRHQPRRLSRELEQRILAAREYAKAGPLIVAGQLGLPASTVWKVLRRYGVSRLRRPAPRAGRPLRARAAGRARARRHQEARPLLDGRQAHPTATGSHRSRHAGWQYLHLAIDDHSRLAYAELLREREPGRLRRLPAPRRRLVSRARHQRRARPLRQRQRLPLPRLGGRLRRARHRSPLHPPPAAADQRQGRSARQDAAARMGLPLRLPDQRPPRPSAPRLPALVQPTPTAQLARRPAADQPRLTGRGRIPCGPGRGRQAATPKRRQ